MVRFEEIRQVLKPLKPKSKAGLDNFGNDKCDMCRITFDAKDAKIWTRETGKVHFDPCYLNYKKNKGPSEKEVKKT